MTTFVLIPLIGLSLILQGLGLTLLLAAIFTLPLRKLRQMPALLAALLAVTLGLLFAPGQGTRPAGATRSWSIPILPTTTFRSSITGQCSEMRFDRFVESSIVNRQEQHIAV